MLLNSDESVDYRVTVHDGFVELIWWKDIIPQGENALLIMDPWYPHNHSGFMKFLPAKKDYFTFLPKGCLNELSPLTKTFKQIVNDLLLPLQENKATKQEILNKTETYLSKLIIPKFSMESLYYPADDCDN